MQFEQRNAVFFVIGEGDVGAVWFLQCIRLAYL